jgi:hypothetical protein
VLVAPGLAAERPSRRRRVVEACYVVAIATLAAIATSDPTHLRRRVFATTLALCLPALIGLLPVLYIVVSTAFNLTGADNGGIGWPVTATYALVLGFGAAMNVVLFRIFLSPGRRRRSIDQSAV